jgi:hypothetical protein
VLAYGFFWKREIERGARSRINDSDFIRSDPFFEQGTGGSAPILEVRLDGNAAHEP